MAASAFKGLQKVLKKSEWRGEEAFLSDEQAVARMKKMSLDEILEPFSFEGYHDLVEDLAARRPNAIAQVNRMLETAGLTGDAVMAQTLCENLEAIRTMETMIAMAERRLRPQR